MGSTPGKKALSSRIDHCDSGYGISVALRCHAHLNGIKLRLNANTFPSSALASTSTAYVSLKRPVK